MGYSKHMNNQTIAVIAANGRSGSAFVLQALSAGHIIRAGVRGQSFLPTHPNLTVIECDATNPQQVRQLITGSDAVVSFIGHVPKSPATVQTDAMKVLVAVMSEVGIKRLISLTGTGARFAGDTPSLIDRLLNIAVGLVDPARVSDGKTHAEVLKASSLDWTIVRVLKLGEGQHRGRVRLSATGPAELLTPRNRVAAAVLQLLDSNDYIRQAPIIAGVD